MRFTFHLPGLWCLLASTCLLTANAAAQAPVATDDVTPIPQAVAVGEPELFAAAAVDTETLAGQRGGNANVRNDMVLTGTTADNTAQHVNTGNNAISAGSFANMSGIPVVIQNSGANVLIQNAVILNLQMN